MNDDSTEYEKMQKRVERMREALEVFMPTTGEDFMVLKGLPDDEVVKIRCRGDRLKAAIEIWEETA